MSRKSILAITSEIPWPLNTGGHIRSFHIIKAVSNHFDVTLVVGVDRPDPAAARVFHQLGIKLVEVSIRKRQFLEEIWRIVAAMIRREPYVMYHRHNRQEVREFIAAEIQNHEFQAIYLDHVDPFAFRDQFPEVPLIADLHNVYSMLVARVSDEHVGLKRWYLQRESRLIADIEKNLADGVSALMAVSSEEASYFRSLGATNVSVVPNGVDCSAYRHLPIDRRSGPPILVFVGALSWQPNAKAAEYLAREVMPAIRQKYPDAILKLVGRNPGQSVLELAGQEGVEVHGNVPDIGYFLAEATLLAVALDSGGGTRLKILEAFAAGLPVLSTRVGCEGIVCTHGKELWIAERESFSDAAVHLIEHPEEARQLAVRARQLVESRYDWKIIGESACRAVASAIGSAKLQAE